MFEAILLFGTGGRLAGGVIVLGFCAGLSLCGPLVALSLRTVPAPWRARWLLYAGGPLAVLGWEAVQRGVFAFPWFAFGDWLLDGPLEAWIGTSGAHASGVVTLALAATGASAFLERGPAAWRRPAFFLAFSFAFFYSISILTKPARPTAVQTFRARVIALNGSRHAGRQADATERLARYARLSQAGGAELLFWPESAGDEHIETFAPVLRNRLSQAGGVPRVLLGARQAGPSGKYNIVYDLERGQAVYRKRRLVPFTEYVPGSIFRELFAAAGLTIKNNDLLAATDNAVALVSDTAAVYPLLCYEIAYPGLMNDTRTPGFILNAGNETWFATGAVRRATLRQARSRALESGLAVVRAVSAGYSGFIDPYGPARVAMELPATRLDATLPVYAPGATFYVRLGWIAVFFAPAVLGLAAIATELSLRALPGP